MSDKHKVAIVTGAGSGIGRAVALTLLKNGFAVSLAGRRLEPLNETIALAGDVSGLATAFATDVTDADSVQSLFAKTSAVHGQIDVLFNNAGISGSGALMEDLSLEEWRRIVDINLTGSFLCTQNAFRFMKAQNPIGGRIINNGSVSATSPRPNSAAYTATKHAMTGLTKSTSLDGRKYNIACGQIDIGNASTDMTSKMSAGVPQADGSIGPEPTVDVQHIADAVLYMAKLPLDANVQTMTVMATKMPLVGRG